MTEDEAMARAADLVARGAFGDAVAVLEADLARIEGEGGAESLSAARVLNDLGVACKFAGRFDDAEACYGRAIALIERFEGSEGDDMATLLHNIGGLAHSRHRYADGLGPARAGLAMRQRLHGADHPAVASDAAALAALLEGMDRLDEAEQLYRRALVGFDAAGDVHHAAMTRNGLGSVCQSLERLDEAQAYYEAALEQLDHDGRSEHPDLGRVLNNLATLHRSRGEDPEARALLARAHDLLVRTLGDEHPVTIEVAGNRRRVESTPSPYV